MRLTPEQALERLQPQGKKKSKGADPLKHITTFGEADDDLYIFGNSQGGVLSSSLDTLPSIIGTWEGDCGDIPPALQDMIIAYANEVEWWERVGESLQQPEGSGLIPDRAPKAPRQSIPMMIVTKWGQSSPYNDGIIFGGKTCPAGCNTTAAAQLMFHWGELGYHRGCEPTKAYKTRTNGYKVEALPALTVFDYKHLAINPKTAEEKKAVQELMTYIGFTFQSDYTPKETSAYPKQVARYMRENLRMGSFISYIYASKLGESSFENYIYNELLQSRPVMMAGWTTRGGGHTFLADGYDVEKDMYHMNWGWGGSYNGWFKMSALNPTSSRAYNTTKVAIIGIQPDYKLGDVNGDGEVDITDAMQVMQDAKSGKYSKQADVNSDGQLNVTDVQLIIDKILGRIEL